MLFRDGKPVRTGGGTTELSPEMLKLLIEGVSAKVTQNLSAELGKRSGPLTAAETAAIEADSEHTLRRLAEAMTVAGKVQGKNFESLGEVKKIKGDQDRTKDTLKLLKDMEQEHGSK
jgi:hypothetical protein